ncbi:hypothetical protein HYS47_03065 [Candidatus Woesearchaeota archaeon]|nr:hypothetical protein [Candidatus Woesearchaeota archaeon]
MAFYDRLKTTATYALCGLAALAALKVLGPRKAEASPLDNTLIYAAPNFSVSTATDFEEPHFGLTGGLKVNNKKDHGVSIDASLYGFDEQQIGKIGAAWRPMLLGNNYDQIRLPVRAGLVLTRGGEKQVDFAPSIGLEGLFTIGNFVLTVEAGIDSTFKGGGFKEAPDVGVYALVGGCL